MVSALALDAIMSIGGLIIPPAVDLIKKKFVPASNDTPERTMGTLATTKPEALPAYVEGLARLLSAKVEYFNRDVLGQVSQWVVDLRAAIRPITVCGCLGLMISIALFNLDIEPGIRYFCEANVTSWMGSRLVSK